MGAKTEEAWYVLFSNHTWGLLLDKALREAGVRSTIVPTPRALSKSCGMALRVSADALEAARAIIAEKNIEVLDIAPLPDDIDPGRNKYC
ncbi:MAG: DUF3343 domain-containing protein [Synergistaceae bacterium]|nr:DUF3343 domain-containing protein [Synergistaceae bacterium]